jgi:hypothetical protein
MRHRALACTALALAAVLAALCGPATQAAPGPGLPVTVRDRPNDVRLAERTGDLSRATLTSIDVRSVSVRRVGGAVRFTVRLREVISARAGVQQMVFVGLLPASPGQRWQADIGMSPQQSRLAYANLVPDTGNPSAAEVCDPLRSVASRRTRTVRLDVPLRCLPSEPARLSGYAATGWFRSDGGTLSEDPFALGRPIEIG